MLSWDPPLASPGAPLDAYNVYRLVDGIRESLGSVGPGATSYLDGDVDFETHTYLYFVTAQSDNGESAPSNLATTTYPYCLDIVGPDGLRKECYEPLPGGPLSIIIH